MEVRAFKGTDNKNKIYYAVTGPINKIEATKAVARRRKESYETCKEYSAAWGIIAPYKDGLDGLYSASARVKGEPCVIVWRK